MRVRHNEITPGINNSYCRPLSANGWLRYEEMEAEFNDCVIITRGRIRNRKYERNKIPSALNRIKRFHLSIFLIEIPSMRLIVRVYWTSLTLRKTAESIRIMQTKWKPRGVEANTRTCHPLMALQVFSNQTANVTFRNSVRWIIHVVSLCGSRHIKSFKGRRKHGISSPLSFPYVNPL